MRDDTELERLLSNELERCPERDGLWLFAYGSLMWKPEIAFDAVSPAIVDGWQRRFCLWQRRYRGCRERPNLMLALVEGGSCAGLVYRLEGADVKERLAPIWKREMIAYGYEARWVAARTEAGSCAGAGLRGVDRGAALCRSSRRGRDRRADRLGMRSCRARRRVSSRDRSQMRRAWHRRRACLPDRGTGAQVISQGAPMTQARMRLTQELVDRVARIEPDEGYEAHIEVFSEADYDEHLSRFLAKQRLAQRHLGLRLWLTDLEAGLYACRDAPRRRLWLATLVLPQDHALPRNARAAWPDDAARSRRLLRRPAHAPAAGWRDSTSCAGCGGARSPPSRPVTCRAGSM